jgi:lactaldehyde reductase
MGTHVYYVPSVNLIGKGSAREVVPYIRELNLRKALVVTDKFLMQHGIAGRLLTVLDEAGIEYEVYDEVKPNPTCKNVHDGVEFLRKHDCDYLISIGGGSPQDAAKAIGIIATNGGHITQYEGVHQSQKKALPIIAVNTTAGTSSEVTINYVITDEERNVKMVMVDKNSIAAVSVSDPEFMVDKPADLTAATGMDALTHAIEALVTPGSYPVTDATALAAVELIFANLVRTVKNGQDMEARENMVYAVFLAGLAFNNAGLGFVHAMAHQLGGVYDLPHGVCNAMLLPYVEEENAKHVPAKFRPIAKAIGLEVRDKTDMECAEFVVRSIKELSRKVGIPSTLSELGVKEVDLELLAENALKDACAPGNPFMPTKEEAIALFKKIL